MVDAATKAKFQPAYRDALERLDINGMRKLWAYTNPQHPHPGSDADVLASMHMARTQISDLPLKLRFYSHSWLLERNLPSMLPDRLRPSADRMYPRVVKAVGLSVSSSSPIAAPILHLVRGAMEEAVLEAVADGKLDDSEYVKKRIIEAKDRTVAKLLGTTALT